MLFGPDEPYEVTADGLEEHLRGFEPGLSDQSTLFVVVQPAADPNIFVQAASSEEGLIRVEAMVPQGCRFLYGRQDFTCSVTQAPSTRQATCMLPTFRRLGPRGRS